MILVFKQNKQCVIGLKVKQFDTNDDGGVDRWSDKLRYRKESNKLKRLKFAQ